MKQLGKILMTGALFLLCKSGFASDTYRLKVKAGESIEHKALVEKTKDSLRIDSGGNIEVHISDEASEVIINLSTDEMESLVIVQATEERLTVEHRRGPSPVIRVTVPRNAFFQIEIMTDDEVRLFRPNENISVVNGQIYLTDAYGNRRSADSTINTSDNAETHGNIVTNGSSITISSSGSSRVYASGNVATRGSSITIMSGVSSADINAILNKGFGW